MKSAAASKTCIGSHQVNIVQTVRFGDRHLRSTRNKLDHLVLRSTLAMIWISMNAILATGLVLGGVMRMPQLTLGVLLLPALGLGYLLGEQVQKRLPERKLRGLIYSVLLLAGLSLLYKGLF